MNGSGQESTHRAIERVARESYGRLVAYLSSQTRDMACAEDALSSALVAALKAWPAKFNCLHRSDFLIRSPEFRFDTALMTAVDKSAIDSST